MASTAMFTTCVRFSMMMFTMVATHYIRIKMKLTGEECLYRIIAVTLYATVKLDSRFRQGPLCTTADSPADKYFCMYFFQNVCQCSVAGTLRVYYVFPNNSSFLNIIYFKIRGMSEMLKNLFVFKSNCNFHENYLLLKY